MSRRTEYDGVVIGSGPNGLAAAIVLARAGKSVLVLEAQEQIGGAARTAALTLPGYLHDLGSAVHPMAIASPFFRKLPLQDHGLHWITPPIPLAHPFDDGTAAIVHPSVETTSQRLGRDGRKYEKLIGSVAQDWPALEEDVLGPIGIPDHPFAFARFGLHAMLPAVQQAKSVFKSAAARGLFAGLAAHSAQPLENWGTSAVALVLGAMAHGKGWPIPKGGAQSISNALASYLQSLGGEIETGAHVQSLKELPPAKVILCDVSPRGLLEMAGDELPRSYARALGKYEYGPGVFKVDWALSGPIPWRAAECARAGTVHVGGTLEEIAQSERDLTDRPFVLLSQPSLFDSSRAPEGKHTAWAYCHIPWNCGAEMTSRIELQVERFAPGFGKLILARSDSDACSIGTGER